MSLSWRVSGGMGVLNATLPGSAEARFVRPRSCPSHTFTVTAAAGIVLSRSNEAIVVLGGGAYQFQC